MIKQVFRYREPIKLSYTPKGIKMMGLVISATLEARNWSARKLAKESGITAPTVIRYADGDVVEPQTDIIKKIAPLIYKAIRFFEANNLEVEIDPNETYGEQWEDLAKIATGNFEEIMLSSTREGGDIVDFAEMIKRAMQINGISQEYLESEIQKKINCGAFISLERLHQIQKGQNEKPLEPEERQIIYVVVDPDRKVFSYEEWVVFELGGSPVDHVDNHLQDNGQKANHY